MAPLPVVHFSRASLGHFSRALKLGVAFVSLSEGIDATTPAGRLQLHVLGAIAEFERARIAGRVKAGLQRARRDGQRLGRPMGKVPVERVSSVAHLSIAAAADALSVSTSTLKRWRRVVQKSSKAVA